MRFFVDNNLSPRLAQGMTAFGEAVIHLRDEFPGETPDVEWLRFVGESGYFLLSRDENILRNPEERAAFQRHGIGAFFLGGKKRDHCQLIQQLVKSWPKIKRRAEKSHRPFAYRVPPSGSKLKPIPLT